MLCAACVLTAVLKTSGAPAPASASGDGIISWGVTPNTKELTPEPPKGGAEILKKYNGMFVADTAGKKLYFTFDLGYEAGYTAAVLDILKEHRIKAVFFVCGNYLKEKELIGRMIAEGHSMGNHTDKHKDLPALADGDIQKDIADLQTQFKERYPDQPMMYFRPPKGRFNERAMSIAHGAGLKTLMWSIAIVDWGRAPINAAENAAKIEKRLHPGAIILLHITNAGTPEMLKLLIPKAIAKGYSFGRPEELLIDN